MKIQLLSNQKFEGKVNILGNYTISQRKNIDAALPTLENIVKNKNYDLFINQNQFKEIYIGSERNHGYITNGNNIIEAALLAVRDVEKGSYKKRKQKQIEEYLMFNNM